MLNSSKKTILVAILALSGSYALASSDLFKTLDTDDSGTISAAEASVHSVLNEMFATLDVDSNGELSPEEFAAAGLDE